MARSFLHLAVAALAATAPCAAFTGASFGSNKPSFLSMSASESAESTIRVGIFGGGTVGGGIVDILDRKSDYVTALTGKNIEVRKICVRDASKPRDFDLPDHASIVTNFDDILDDPEIDMVVEVMGGTTAAKDVIFSALKNGKDVVTANKALIAQDLTEIESLVGEVNKGLESGDEVEFRYEAAVCGGIPIIRSLQSDFVGDSISMMSGIINGCTNFMLSAMDRDGKSYDEALAEASALGYAEADPTLDVGGFDARSKLKILMRLGFGVEVSEDEISCRGITELMKVDFDYAKMLGGTIKLLGVAKALDDESVTAFVSPCYVTNDDSLASVSDATNAIEVKSENLVSSTYIGQGAGRYPTANSCVNDIVALAKGDQTFLPFNPGSQKKMVNNFESVFYLRLKYRDSLGITRQCGEICEKHGVSIHSILQNPVTKNDDSAFVIMTENVGLKAIKNVVADIEALDWCSGPALYMPVLREDWVR